MTDGDVAAEDTGEVVGQMQNRIVLNVGVIADNNAVNVASEHCVVPNARTIAQSHIPQNDCARGDVNASTERRLSAQEFVQLLVEFVHLEIKNTCSRLAGLSVPPRLPTAQTI